MYLRYRDHILISQHSIFISFDIQFSNFVPPCTPVTALTANSAAAGSIGAYGSFSCLFSLNSPLLPPFFLDALPALPRGGVAVQFSLDGRHAAEGRNVSMEAKTI